MQHLGVNFRGIWGTELFLYLGFYFFAPDSALIFNSPVTTPLATWYNGVNAHRPRANRAFVTFRENTAPMATTGLGQLNAKFTFKGMSPPIIFVRIVRPMDALQLRH